MRGRLLDSCILIDMLRADRDAIQFAETLPSKPYISMVTLSELFHGARNVSEEERIERQMKAAILVPIGRDIAKQAGILLKHYHRSHNISLADALIAATAEHHELALVTLNVKHYPMFPDLQRAY